MWVNGDDRIFSDMLSENVVQEYLCGIYTCILYLYILFREQIQTVIKPRFYPRLCQFLMKVIPVINCV